MRIQALCLGLLVTAANLLASEKTWQDEYQQLLDSYVRPAGVDYQSWKKNPADLQMLDWVTQEIARPKNGIKWSSDGLKAYRINAYNAWVLYLVLKAYPIKSVKDIAPEFGFFSMENIQVSGQTMSLNYLEKELLLKEFKDPKIHFAINCASRSCPPLSTSIYLPEQLDAQLEEATTQFINENPLGVQKASQPDQSMRISELFKWYAHDFQVSGSVRNFINRYRRLKIPDNMEINYIPYDWSLNKKQAQ